MLPQRLLWRDYVFSREPYQAELTAINTRALAEVPVDAVGVVAPVAPVGAGNAQQWVAWTVGRDLTAVLGKEGKYLATAHHRLTADVELVGPALIYPDPVAETTPLSLLLASRAGSSSPLFQTLDFDGSGKLLGSHQLAPQSHASHVALTHLSPEQRWVLWSESVDAARARLRLSSWSRSHGFGSIEEVLEVSGQLHALAASATPERLRLSALSTQAKPNDVTEVCLSWQEQALPMKAAARRRPGQSKRWKIDHPLLRADLVIAEPGDIWVLLAVKTESPSGSALLLASSAMNVPLVLPRPPGASHESVLVAEDNTPFLLRLDPLRGWQVELISIPSTEKRPTLAPRLRTGHGSFLG